MSSEFYDSLLARARAIKAKIHADIGPPINPQDEILKFLGFKIRPGDRLLDTVSGQEVVVAGGTIANVNSQSPRVIPHPGSVRPPAEWPGGPASS